MVARLPEATDQLLAHIPRLEAVRVMLANAQEPFRQSEAIQPEAETQLVTLGAKLIKAATVFDALTQSGLSSADAVGIMRAQRQRCKTRSDSLPPTLHELPFTADSLLFKT